jgi:hypothetical protein
MGVGGTDYYYWGYSGKQLLVKNWMKTAACKELDENSCL